MASLKNVILDFCVRRIAASYLSDGGNQSSSEKDLAFLNQLLDEKNAQITRLKRTDKKRSEIHGSLKNKFRKKQKECRELRYKCKAYRMLLRKRAQAIKSLHIQLRGIKLERFHFSLHELNHLRVSYPSASNWFYELVSRWRGIHELLWKHWMRLGVLDQYSPAPVVIDKQLCARRHRVRNLLKSQSLPSISIVTPSYNQAAFLSATLESVLHQDYPALEYVVMDGGSQDGSVDLIKKIQNNLTFWQSKPDGGQATAIREGFKKTTAEIMGWLNSDDALMPGALYMVGDIFRRHPEIDVVYGHRVIINSQGQEVGRWVLPKHDSELLLYADFIPQETCFWRRKIYDRVGGIDPAFHFAMDWDLFLRFQKAGARFYRAPYFLGLFRTHTEQKTNSELKQHGYPEMQKLRNRELGNHFTRCELQRNVSRAQMFALISLALMRLGIRY